MKGSMNMSKIEKDKLKENKAYSLPGKEEPTENRKAKSQKLQQGQKNGLYAALGVCLVSIAAAALITYMGFTDTLSSDENTVTPINSASSVINSEQSEVSSAKSEIKTQSESLI